MALTPMIDVVFLLLVFFMLAARFGVDDALTLSSGSPSGDYSGPPRLIAIEADLVRLNGVVTSDEALADAVRPLLSVPDDLIVLRAGEGVSLQRLVDVMSVLNGAGFSNLVVLE